MVQRQAHHPLTLTATATHDTKRGEDARARLFALSADPERWIEGFSRWRQANSALVRIVGGKPAPEPEFEWMICQAITAVWPDGLDADDGACIAELRDRFSRFLQKAVREAKLRTSWTGIDEEYEAAIQAYAHRLFEPGSAFLTAFVHDTEPFRVAGRRNALSQLLVKLTAPGIPDIYQGTEFGDFSMVDPDNRRPIDFASLHELLETCDPPTRLAHWKAMLLSAGLAARRDHADLFVRGDYLPLEIEGEERSFLVAYGRASSTATAIVVASRVVRDGLTEEHTRWEGLSVRLPRSLAGRRYVDVISGSAHDAQSALQLAEVMGDLPCALLVSG